jgi:hypothetical protein
VGIGVAAGDALGMHMTFRFVDTGTERSPNRSVEITAALPRWHPVSLDLRWRSTFVGGQHRREFAVDTADREFHRRFLIEGAPIDVVRELIDADARADLLLLPVCAMRIVRGPLRFTVQGWLDPQFAELAVRLVARIATRVPEAYAAADDATPSRLEGAPFRQELTDAGARAAAERREVEHRDLQEILIARFGDDAEHS